MRYLPNLTSHDARPGEPWMLSDASAIPTEVRANKGTRDKWISDPATQHNCFSTWEGLNENQRIKKRSQGKDGDTTENPPLKCYGFIADYDAKLGDAEVASGFDRLSPNVPNYFGRSLSGNVHLIWVFEKPLTVGSFELAEEFLKHVSDKLRLRECLPAFDENFIDCAKYYTNGCQWFTVSEQRISYNTALGWLINASAKVKYAAMGYNVPLSVVKGELDKNPKFIDQWAGIDFQLGATGPTWFVEGSVSPKSAIVKESGMYTFSSHATKDFYSWGELIGFSFVDQYRASHIGDAVSGVYFDGRSFWREISRGDWKAFTKDDILSYLRVARGLSDKVVKGDNASELELAYQHLIDHNHVEGAAPFVFKKNGPITINNKPFLNIHTARVLRPVDQPVEWGHPEHFPWLSTFFGNPTGCGDPTPRAFFKGGPQALDTFISWLAYYYRTAYEMNIASGHNIFISGPVNIGKTLLNREIIGGLMNGFREAKEYLMGEDDFGSELFSVAHWVVDDGTMSTSMTAHRRWSEIIKRMAANKTFRYHAKFQNPQQVQWEGRVVSTLNNDEESARLLPDMDRSLVDKIHLYMTSDLPTVDFPKQADLKAILEQELPYFAKFLLQWQTPIHCTLFRGEGIDYRFGGIKPWHDPAMTQHANQSARTAGFAEILDDWRTEYFRLVNENKPSEKHEHVWTGTAFQLRKALCVSPATQDALRGTDNGDIGRLLAQLKSKGYPITSEDKDELRYWQIAERGHVIEKKPSQ